MRNKHGSWRRSSHRDSSRLSCLACPNQLSIRRFKTGHHKAVRSLIASNQILSSNNEEGTSNEEMGSKRSLTPTKIKIIINTSRPWTPISPTTTPPLVLRWKSNPRHKPPLPTSPQIQSASITCIVPTKTAPLRINLPLLRKELLLT